jgi:hypothetical protein
MKFRMTKKCPYEEAPNLGHQYDLIYINSKDLAECIGNESTGCYYIIDNDEIIGSNKILENGYASDIINNIIDKSSIPFMKIVHIGKLRVVKINKWGSHKFGFEFAIIGEAELFQEPIYESKNLNLWNDYVKGLISKYNWEKHLQS